MLILLANAAPTATATAFSHLSFHRSVTSQREDSEITHPHSPVIQLPNSICTLLYLYSRTSNSVLLLILLFQWAALRSLIFALSSPQILTPHEHILLSSFRLFCFGSTLLFKKMGYCCGYIIRRRLCSFSSFAFVVLILSSIQMRFMAEGKWVVVKTSNEKTSPKNFLFIAAFGGEKKVLTASFLFSSCVQLVEQISKLLISQR